MISYTYVPDDQMLFGKTGGYTEGSSIAGLPQPKTLSRRFVDRLSRFLLLDVGWDGASGEPVPFEVANRAATIAFSTLEFAPEPFVAPSPDGSLLLQWDVAPERSIEFYVDEAGTYENLSLIVDAEVREIPIRSVGDLVSFIGEQTHLGLGSRR